jgi:hypothetical protein
MAAGLGIKMRILGIVALGAALGGCASSASDITPAYVSPVAYQGYPLKSTDFPRFNASAATRLT